MKLCVLTKRIQEEPLYQRDGAFLYNLSLDEYKKMYSERYSKH